MLCWCLLHSPRFQKHHPFKSGETGIFLTVIWQCHGLTSRHRTGVHFSHCRAFLLQSNNHRKVVTRRSQWAIFKLFFFSITLQGWPRQAFSWYNAILLSRVLASAESKRAGGRPSIKLSAKETLYPQLLWQLWETAISALCIIVHALLSSVSERQRAELLSVDYGTFVIVNHQHFSM